MLLKKYKNNINHYSHKGGNLGVAAHKVLNYLGQSRHLVCLNARLRAKDD